MYGFDEKRLEQIDRHARKRVEAEKMLGACSAVIRGGQIVKISYEGYARMDKTPLQPGAIFRLASMSKPITAVAIMIQSERGELKITDPVGKYLPEFQQMYLYDGTPAHPVEIRHLLSHSSGIGQDAFGVSEQERVMPKAGETLADVMERYGKTRLPFLPGARASYSGLMGFDILARVVEVTSGMKFSDFLQENIFDPLGMKDTTFHPTPEQKARIVELCVQENGKLKGVPLDNNFEDLPDSYEAGSAALLGTLEDYTRFVRMLLGKGKLDGVRILSPRTVEQMGSPALPYEVPGSGKEMAWGLGMRVILHLNGYSAPLSVGTFGWSGAYGTHFFVDPTLDVAAVYMSNRADAGGAGADTAFEFENDVISALTGDD